MIPDEASTIAEGVEFYNGEVRTVRGYKEFAGTVTTPLTGTVMDISRVNGVPFAITTEHAYKYASGSFTSIDGTTAMTGDEDDIISTSFMNNLFIWSNGRDAIQEYDFSSTADLAGATGNYLARWMLTFGERLCLYDTTDSGSDFHLRVRWSIAGDCTDWSSAGSGWSDLLSIFDNGDTIMRAEMIGNSVAIYGKYGIALQDYRGEFASPFGFRKIETGVGMSARRALVNVHGVHFFLGWDNVYAFDGSQVVRVGDAIREQLFNEIDPSNIGRCHMDYIEGEQKIRLYIPYSTDGSITKCYQYCLQNKSWTTIPYEFTAVGQSIIDNSPTWENIGGTWNDQAAEWNDKTILDAQTLLLYGDSSGQIFYDDGTSLTFNGDTIGSIWATKEFAEGDDYTRKTTYWMELTFEAKGYVIVVYYRTYGKYSWEFLGLVTLDQNRYGWTTYRVDLAVSSPTIQFMFAAASTNYAFKIRNIQIGFVPGSEIVQ